MIYQIFFNSLKTKHDAIALVTSKDHIFTYEMVEHRVNQWATYLIKQGVEEGDRVAVLLDDEDHHIFIFLALDRVNATYVPFDIDTPAHQMVADIAALNLKKIIIETTLDINLDLPANSKITLGQSELAHIDAEEIATPARIYNTDGFAKVAYIVSSSGSTGNKKWIPILGAGLLYWANVETKLFNPHPITKVLATRKPGYDACISEYVRTFSAGGELHLLNRLQRKDLTSVLSACEQKSIDCLLLIASQLNHEQAREIISRLKKSGLMHLMVTGDVCTPYLKDLCEREAICLWNCYGPTEATFGLSILLVNGINVSNDAGLPITPIGRPFGEEVQFHIIEGILYIESPYLTPGYLRAEDNDTAFKSVEIAGRKIKLFNTGDKFEEKDGFLFYKGRSSFDGHCKVDGVKVSPYIIEQCINSYNRQGPASAIEVAVVIKEHLGKTKPVAYIVIAADFDKKAFLAYLKASLKKEEIPILICIDTLPLLSLSQKIDRQQLIARQDRPEDFFLTEESYHEEFSHDAANPQVINYRLEVKKIWEAIFQRDNLPVDVDFIFLGGDSQMAMLMVSQIKERFKNEYSYLTFLSLETHTIDSVAASITNTMRVCERAFIQPLTPVVADQENMFFLPGLIGEGGFSYRHLASRVACKFPNRNIYGLSEPGIADEALLPESMEHAVKRYVLAIKRIQPKGPYSLLGFSFGATLGYEVAKHLHLEGEMVSELHLVDGFPAYIYQGLSNAAHVPLLEALLNFIVSKLNGSYYGEKLKPVALRRFQQYDKEKQLRLGLDFFIEKCVNPASKNLLHVAKRHLMFLLNALPPQEKLPIWPTFYLTNRDQTYLQVINEFPKLSKISADYHYFFWTRYFNNITRCGIELEGEHLSVLQPGADQYKWTADCFWERAHDFVYNLKVDYYGPKTSYRIESSNTTSSQLLVFFLNRKSIHAVYKELLALGLSSKVSFHDKYLKKHEQGDLIYTSQANLFCQIPIENVDDVKAIMKKHDIVENPSSEKKRIQVSKAPAVKAEPSGSIDLVILRNRRMLLTFSFNYHGSPGVIFEVLHKQLNLVPLQPPQQGNFIYNYEFIFFGGFLDAASHVEGFLGDFISVLQGQISEELSQVVAAKV